MRKKANHPSDTEAVPPSDLHLRSKMAMIANALVTNFTNTLVDLMKDEVSMMLGVKEDLRCLEQEVGMISNFLQDAESKAFTKPAVRSWLADLKQIIYDADDLIDECRILHAEKLARVDSSSTMSVRCFSPLVSCFREGASRHQIGSRIRSINDRLGKLKEHIAGLNLIAAAPTIAVPDDRGRSNVRRNTDPVLEPNIVGMGIVEDTNKLVSLLAAEGGPEISVFAIVGMGGIGKTTLAQSIYNNKTIQEMFSSPPPMWVCVSKDYSNTNLMKEIIRCAKADHGNAQSLGELVPILSRALEDKKFFLILDDVWSADVWVDLLEKPLLKGAAGSRVLITTRDVDVAKQMRAVTPYHRVELLSNEEGWALLCKMVFQEEERGIETVEDIGMQIVEKCAGLPLAIKTIAGVLRTKEKTRREWEMVLHNPAWSLTDLPDGVMGALYLSYQDLPFHLKQCFTYCSLFPEDFIFKVEAITRCWIAEGFVKEEREMTIEDVAEVYYKDLITRCLLQPDPTYYNNQGCKVHDLLHSLAQFLSQDENFAGDHVKATSLKNKPRRMSIADRGLTVVPPVVVKQTSLSTLLFRDVPLTDSVPRDLFRSLVHLRVLDFDMTNVKKLPDSVGNLIHLRYLSLFKCPIEELPETIANLHSLQFLILDGCNNLKSLPKSIPMLYNLRTLIVLNTSVSGLPVGIGRLQNLNLLVGFVVNESGRSSRGNKAGEQHNVWCSLEELGSLSHLKFLTVENLESALIGASTRGFLLKDKKNLTNLYLRCTSRRDDELPYGKEEVDNIQRVFEEDLFPPPSVEELEIEGYFGLHYPSWIMASNCTSIFPNLRRLDLVKCMSCGQLPPLGLLPNLDYLYINGATAIENIGSEFMGFGSGTRLATSSYIPFPKLEQVLFSRMPDWIQWNWEVAVAMPSLKILKIVNCPKLMCLPKGLARHATALSELRIREANSLSEIENFTFVKELQVSSVPNLRRISNLPALQSLSVDGCLALREVEGLHSLRSLKLEDTEMEFLPEWLLSKGDGQQLFPMLERLHIVVKGVDFLRRCVVDGPDWPKIQHFSHVHITVEDGPEYLQYTRNPFIINTNLDDVVGRGESADVNRQA